MNKTITKPRIEWVDVMRALAMILVLLAHYNGGRLSIIANRACVQTFFFISGMFAFTGKYTIPQYLKRQLKGILLPYFIFAVINVVFHVIFNQITVVKAVLELFKGFALAKRNETLVAAMWFLPCLFITSIVYKLIADAFKKQKYILAVCFAVSAVFKVFFEDPVYIFSLNQGFKYLIYFAIGNALYPYLKNISSFSFKKLDNRYKLAFIAFLIFDCWYIYLLYKRGYVLWPQPIWALAVVYFLNVVMCIILFLIISVALSRCKPLVWVGRNTIGFCCLENISRALLNYAMAMVGFGFVPDNEIKALVHVVGAMCVGSVIILAINIVCPQLFGKSKTKK